MTRNYRRGTSRPSVRSFRRSCDANLLPLSDELARVFPLINPGLRGCLQLFVRMVTLDGLLSGPPGVVDHPVNRLTTF